MAWAAIPAVALSQPEGLTHLGTFPGGVLSTAFGVSADGSTVVGRSHSGSGQTTAFRWTHATGMVNLGVLNGGSTSVAHGVNGDGSVIVGKATDGAQSNLDRAFRSSASTSGTVLGLFSFDLPGQENKRDWLRAGVGIAAKIGGGMGSAMANATTEGADPAYWLNLSYQVAF